MSPKEIDLTRSTSEQDPAAKGADAPKVKIVEGSKGTRQNLSNKDLTQSNG